MTVPPRIGRNANVMIIWTTTALVAWLLVESTARSFSQELEHSASALMHVNNGSLKSRNQPAGPKNSWQMRE